MSWSHTELSEGEVEELSVKHRIVDDKIREALSKILDIKGSIRMFCRTRPNHLTEKRRNSEPVSAGSERIQIKLGGTRKDFEFDKVFPQETSQCANRCYMCLSDLLGLGGRWIFLQLKVRVGKNYQEIKKIVAYCILNKVLIKKAIRERKLFLVDDHDTMMPYLGRINSTSTKTYALSHSKKLKRP
ncbi:hypothetical protein P8452_44327 [Trifolium repens]|nr:hypothetical protein P8452_44327 [Trifolium repens]